MDIENSKEIGKRISQIIDYKARGRKIDFAKTMGWSAQYVQKLVNGKNIGLAPLETIIYKYKDINARWLITGEGNMVSVASDRLLTWLRLERFIPVMTAEERERIDKTQQYDLSDINRWQGILDTKQGNNEEVVRASMRKQGLCK